MNLRSVIEKRIRRLLLSADLVCIPPVFMLVFVGGFVALFRLIYAYVRSV